MTSTPNRPHSLWTCLGLGVAAGVAGAAMLALIVVAVSLGLGGWLLVVIEAGFGGSSMLAMLLVAAGGVAALVGAALLWRLMQHWWWPLLLAQGRASMACWLVMLTGGLLCLGLSGLALPDTIVSSALQFVSGQNERQRAERPLVQAAQQRLAQLLAAHPEGPEAALIAAVNSAAAVDHTAGPQRSPGRLLTDADLRARIAALEQLMPTVAPVWQTVVLGSIAEIQRGAHGGPPTQGPMSEALIEAGRTGSRAFLVLAAQEQEEIAHYIEKNSGDASADAAWQRALQAYAAAGAGAGFEVARFYDETLPERLLATPLPMFPVARAHLVDAVLSERLWLFAQALGDDAAWDHARPGERDLAMVAALVALELAPAASTITVVNPAQRWTTSPWAMGRWILALRYARGDCLAALELSDSTRFRRRPAVVNQSQPGASTLDMAWAVAWMEVGETCASTDDERAQARMRRTQLDYIRFTPGILEKARAGVAATVAVLR